MMTDMFEWWFAELKTLSNKKKRLLRENLESAKNIYYIEETQLKEMDFLTDADQEILLSKKNISEIEKEYDLFRKKNVEFIPYFDQRYPKRLKQIKGAPYALYVKGELPKEEAAAVAIVGARQCSSYGEKMAIEFAEALSASGVQIISGMARGIDGAGQRGALNVGGHTFAVLGSGPDICYPREHIGLYMDIQKTGGILSEFSPGTQPLREHFPARNRIISGLSDAVLVIEAKPRSGSLITADMSLEQGKDVYALPGPVNSLLSRGCHELIKQGAGILISPEDLLEELKLSHNTGDKLKTVKNNKIEKVLETTEDMVYSKCDLYPKSLDCLLKETKLPPDKLMQQIISLIMKGYLKEVSRNYYIRA